jgi:hypothetical protein
MRKILALSLSLALLVAAVGAVNASTSAEKQTAIDNGLAWLASTQNADGSWSNGYGGATYAVANTGSALLAFTEQYYKPLGWNGHDYTSLVTNATNYILSQAQQLTFGSPNWWGFNGTGNSGMGIWWNYGGEETYTSGLAILPLARLVSNPYGGASIFSPSAVISSTNAVVNGLTYAQVLQQSIDSWNWGQTPPTVPSRYGGWRYFTSQNDSDMSTTQWPIADFLFAASVSGVTVPDGFTKAGVNSWVTACQYADGSVDYQPGAGIINHTHIGGLLMANKYTGGGAGNMANAIDWLNTHWREFGSDTWYGNEGNPYAMWAVYKGLESFYGTTGAGPISNLNPQTTSLDPGAVWNWWEDYCQFLVTTQNADGSWPDFSYWYGSLEAGWYINILNATATTVVPLPPSVGLLGTGILSLLGAGWWRRRKS